VVGAAGEEEIKIGNEKTAAGFPAAVFLILIIVMRNFSSLAGLAATYSSKS
jgi:hypothetical protein